MTTAAIQASNDQLDAWIDHDLKTMSKENAIKQAAYEDWAGNTTAVNGTKHSFSEVAVAVDSTVGAEAGQAVRSRTRLRHG